MINNLIDSLNLNGTEKFSETLDDLDKKYNISQKKIPRKYNVYSHDRYDKLKEMKDIAFKFHLL